MDGPVRRRWIVSGRVQGVGFRAWTVRRARELGLRGLVCNLPDGNVDVEVEGPLDVTQTFRRLLARGPVLARVADITDAEPRPGVLPFPFDVAFG